MLAKETEEIFINFSFIYLNFMKEFIDYANFS